MEEMEVCLASEQQEPERQKTPKSKQRTESQCLAAGSTLCTTADCPTKRPETQSAVLRITCKVSVNYEEKLDLPKK